MRTPSSWGCSCLQPANAAVPSAAQAARKLRRDNLSMFFPFDLFPRQAYALEQADEAHQAQRKRGDDQDRREHLVVGERLADARHIHAQAAHAAEPLGDDCGDDGVGGADLEAAEELLGGCGELRVDEDLQVGGVHRAHEVDDVAVNRGEAVGERHGHGEERREHDEDDLGEDAIAEPQHQERGDGDGGHGLRERDEGLDGETERLITVHEDGEDEAEHHADGESEPRLEKRRHRMRPDEREVAHQRGDHGDGARQHERRDETERAGSLPYGEHGGNRDGGHGLLFGGQAHSVSLRWHYPDQVGGSGPRWTQSQPACASSPICRDRACVTETILPQTNGKRPRHVTPSGPKRP